MAEPDQIERLQRRLQRERAARLAAEAIAEKGTRELYEQAERLKLLEAVAAAANLGRNPRRVFRATVQRICDYARWPLGHVYVVGADGLLVSERTWRGSGARRFRRFRESSEQSAFRSGEGLPGRVMADGRPAWVRDLAEDSNFPRWRRALRCGLRAAFAFPVLVGDDVVGVLEFFAEKTQEPDEAFLHAMGQIGVQLGRAIERDRAHAKERAANARLKGSIREAERQRRAAETASRAKSAFLALASHEIRTPLNAVLGLAEALAREPLTPSQGELVDGVRESGAMLLRLLSAVLDLSRIESGKMGVETAPFDLGEAVEAVARVWRPKAGELGRILQSDVEGLGAPCVIASDKAKIEQTLVNLLSNALKFSPPGSPVRVAARAVRRRDRRILAQIEVLDEGPGIPVEDRERLFRPFEQSALGRQAGGAGLGLAICAGNAAALGGRVGHDLANDGASRFWFEFPADLAAEPRRAAPERPDEAAELERPMRVLAAEDNLANQRVLKLLLEPLGLDLTIVGDGALALEAAASSAFDLVLMDANMPNMDGVAAVKAIRALPGPAAATPIHMLTANVFDEDIARYRASGADGVLKKPIDVAALFAVVQSAAAGPAMGEPAAGQVRAGAGL